MVFLRSSLPFTFAAGAVLPVAVFSHKATAPLFIAIGAIALVRHVLIDQRSSSFTVRIGLILAALPFWGLASTMWSLTPERSFQAAWLLAGFALFLVSILSVADKSGQVERTQIQSSLLAGMGIGVVLMLIEALFDMPLMRVARELFGLDASFIMIWKLKPAMTICVILFWPALVVLHRMSIIHWSFILAMAAVVLVTAALVGSAAAILGMVFGGVVFLLILRCHRVVRSLISLIVVVGVMGAPWIMALLPDPRVSMRGIDILPNSAIHRLVIWRVVIDHIHQRPWLGHGLDTTRSLYSQNSARLIELAEPTSKGMAGFVSEPIPLHPHNMILQVWVELGAIGACIMLGAILGVLYVLAHARIGDIGRAAGYGLCTTAFIIAAVSYGAWQGWWLSVLGLSAAIFVAVLVREPNTL
jgi:O-antigen ligase